MAVDRESQLLKAAYTAGIHSPKELANFMAQVSHESNGLAQLEEGFRYTKGPDAVSGNVRSALRNGPQALEVAWRDAMQGKPQYLAELMYGGRMGNDQPGDGYKYRGRGYMQLTGKDQYRAAGEALGLDLVKNPDLASQPENASRIAVWYWKTNIQTHGTRATESVREAASVINTGEMGNTPNGLKDRQTRFSRWEAALTPEMMKELANGNLGNVLPLNSPAKAAKQPAHSGIPSADNNLRLSETGEQVVSLQTAINALGYTGKDGKPLDTSVQRFGPNTEHAIKSFQEAHALKPVDGTAGPMTLKALEHAKAHPLVSETTHPSNTLYKAMQQQLPPGTKPAVIANVTLQAMENGITDPSKLRDVVPLQNGDVLVRGNVIGAQARIDLQAPTPNMQAMSDHMAKEVTERQSQEQQQVQVRQHEQQPAMAR